MASMNAAPIAELSPVTTFHLSVNVSDLNRSIGFYRALFGCEPAKCRADYAKFELADPPLVFSLEPPAPSGQGQLNHAGFRLRDHAALERTRQRLAQAGIEARQEEGVECCYSRQTKFWAHDPDGCLWEVYVLEADLEHRGEGQSVEAIRGGASPPSASRDLPVAGSPPTVQTWDHHLGQPCAVPAGIPPGSLDEVRLSGSFNVPVEPALRDRFLAEIFRSLRPGGKIVLHQLTADRTAPTPFPTLAGPAAVVRAAPRLTELLQSLGDSGFTAARLLKYNSRPCFQLGDVQLRETRLAAVRPPCDGPSLTVVYRGPCASLVLDDGTTVARGVPCAISPAAWQALQESGLQHAFTPIEAAAVASCGA